GPRGVDAAAERRAGLARAGTALRRRAAVGRAAALSAAHTRARRYGAHGVGHVVVPRRPLRDAGRLRPGRRARHGRALAARPGGGRARLPRRAADDLARLPVPRGAARLPRLRPRRPPGRPDVSLAARRAGRARVRAARRRLADRTAPERRPPSRSLGVGRAGGGARRPRPPPLALQARPCAARRDPLLRHARGARPHARVVGQRRTVCVCPPAPRQPRRQRGVRARRGERARPHRRRPRSGRDLLAPVDARPRLDVGLAPGRAPRARAHDHRRGALPPSRRRPLGGGRTVEPRRRAPVAARRRRARRRVPPRDRRGARLGGNRGHVVDPRARRRGRARRGAARGRVLRGVRALVRRAGGHRPRADLRGRLRGGRGVRRARGLGDGAPRGRLDADVPVLVRRRLPAREHARRPRLQVARRRHGVAAEPASARVRARVPARAAAPRRAVRDVGSAAARVLSPVHRALGRRLRRAHGDGGRALPADRLLRSEGHARSAVARVVGRRAPARLRGGARLRFPDGFLWGVATSAFQIEGSLAADGRGPSIWDDFPSEAGETGAVACDGYRRWREDVDLIASLGVNAYRFSLAWPRILPDGGGRVERRGLDHYARLVDALLERGVEPVVTLYHWDLPASLDWRDRDTAERFAEYAAVCFDALGDRVSWWLTINEPWIVGLLGFLLGLHAPGISGDLRAEVTVFHHLLLAHGRAVEAFGGRGRIGLAPNLAPHYPVSGSAADAEASYASDGYVNRWFLDAIYKGAYPDDQRRRYEQLIGPLDFVHDGDLATISRPIDYLGVN